MQKDIIEQLIREIPVSPLVKIHEDTEIWEHTDGGAHFKMTKHTLPLPDGPTDILALSVSGTTLERVRVANEFMEVLGKPAEKDMIIGPDSGQVIEYYLWYAPSF